jgi:hypothetical protein
VSFQRSEREMGNLASGLLKFDEGIHATERLTGGGEFGACVHSTGWSPNG